MCDCDSRSGVWRVRIWEREGGERGGLEGVDGRVLEGQGGLEGVDVEGEEVDGMGLERRGWVRRSWASREVGSGCSVEM